jgi:hypothetical protein
LRAIAIAVLAAALGVSCCFLYASRATHIVLYSHGTPEVPQGRMFTIFNPFRNRTSEHTAEKLIQDLRTSACDSIVRELDRGQEYDPRVCSVMLGTNRQRLVWRRDEESAKVLVYAIPEKQARIWIGFRRDEDRFGVSSVSVVR